MYIDLGNTSIPWNPVWNTHQTLTQPNPIFQLLITNRSRFLSFAADVARMSLLQTPRRAISRPRYKRNNNTFSSAPLRTAVASARHISKWQNWHIAITPHAFPLYCAALQTNRTTARVKSAGHEWRIRATWLLADDVEDVSLSSPTVVQRW